MPEADFRVARLDIRKLRDYCLNAASPRGSHKARVFRSALGITVDDADWLGREILRLLPDADAIAGPVDRHGARFRVDLRITRQERQTVVRTAWIVAPGSAEPRFVSCWVL